MTTEKSKKRPASLESRVVKTKTARIAVSQEVIRDMARLDYVTDFQSRSVAETHAREDREYKDIVSLSVFSSWSESDRWAVQRAEFWEEQERRFVNETHDKGFAQRYRENTILTEAFDSWSEYLRPQKDTEGKVKKYPDGHYLSGLPMFQMEPRSLTEVVKAVVEIGKMLQIRRGDATVRVETTGEVHHVVDPVVQRLSVPVEVLREISKRVLEQRQPELLTSEVLDIPLELGDGSYTPERPVEEIVAVTAKPEAKKKANGK